MNVEKIFTGDNEDEIWQQLSNDFKKDDLLLQYTAVLNQQSHRVILSIDIDPGGGFEGSFETTTFISNLDTTDDFRFAIHHEGFLDEIGKFFGMQDVVIGYPEFDKRVIVKTNDEQRVKSIFSDNAVRKVFETLEDYTFSITTHQDSKVLEFTIEMGLTDLIQLREIYSAFFKVLKNLSDKE